MPVGGHESGAARIIPDLRSSVFELPDAAFPGGSPDSTEGRDRSLLKELQMRNRVRNTLHRPFQGDSGIIYRNAQIGRLAENSSTSEGLAAITGLLSEKGTLDLAIRNGYNVRVNGITEPIVTIGATETEVHGDMSEKIWVRDQTLSGKALFELWRSDPV